MDEPIFFGGVGQNVDSHEAVNLMPNYSHFAIKHADAKVHTILDVTSEIQQLVIARAFSDLRIE